MAACRAKGALESEFDDDVMVIASPDEGRTGRFEVSLQQSGKLVHSKDTRGQGKCDSTSEQQAVIDAIQEYIDNS